MSKNVYSVTQVNNYIDRMFQDDFMLGNLTISGEVSNCKYNHTGHIYFTLKDDKTSISCVMFAGNRIKGLKFPMKDGDSVVINGYVGIYQAAGKYQVYAKSIELDGVGDLYAKFELLKKELEESGMFDSMYKKPIPRYAQRIGIVTAPTGAAVHDIIRVSKRRNPFVELILYKAQVQGEAAKQSIVAGIKALDELDLDVIIIGRGGGSIEDLWAFNEIEVAKAIFNCNTPIISAVGHEVDFTIADFVADVRAATPSQAAEIANFIYEDFAGILDRYSDRFNISINHLIDSYENRLMAFKKQLALLAPANRIKVNEDKLKQLSEKLERTMQYLLENRQNQLAMFSTRLDALSPAKRLSKGFGYITLEDNTKVDSIDKINVGDVITTRIIDGEIKSKITKITNQ